MWLWSTSPTPNYILNVATSIAVVFLGVLGHLVMEEFRKTAAVYHFRRHVPLLRSKSYAFAMLFTVAVMVSIAFHIPIRARFALSRPAMDAFAADVLANPEAPRPATIRMGSYVIQAEPDRYQRSDGALMFHLAHHTETGFTYSTTPIGYPGGNEGAGGSLGGGWYWFSDE